MKTWTGFCGVDRDGNLASPVTAQPDWDTSRQRGVTMVPVEVREIASKSQIADAFAMLRVGSDFASAAKHSGIPAEVLMTLWNSKP